MIPPYLQSCIQIVCTNVCNMNCCHCSQSCPLVPPDRRYYMSLEQVEQGLKSLEGYPGHIGLFGGEPTLHPEFKEICKLYQKYVPVKARRELWTNGARWKQYEKIIEDTFYRELIAYNEHEEQQSCWHQPVNIGIREMLPGNLLRDEGLPDRQRFIDNCWVQQRWSSAITPMGAYFCEVASAREYILNREPGLKVEPGWWKSGLVKFFGQMKSCQDCSMCLPMPEKANDSQEWDDVSPEMYRKFLEVGCKKQMKIAKLPELRQFLKDKTWEPETEYGKRGWWKGIDWKPNVYRPYEEKKHQPSDVRRQNERQNINSFTDSQSVENSK